MRHGIWASVLTGVMIAVMMTLAPGAATGPRRQSTAEAADQAIDKADNSIQLVTFPKTGWSSVKVVRGASSTKDTSAPPPEKAETAEIVSFDDSPARPVRIMRGELARGSSAPAPQRMASAATTQLVTFADPRDRPVSVLRGSMPSNADVELFGPASIADLDRVAFAVDGAESSHGADLGMWRPEPSGPQGPMQVTEAAAIDVGGGNRFDLTQNRALGRAYLALMYQRYGNWPDAIAAYNWGPGNVDAWISGGRAANRFPLEVERYRQRVLREAAPGRGGVGLGLAASR
ncbi:MAG: lytic transglycosylase domain-containing protein [Stellaceae bacterium]